MCVKQQPLTAEELKSQIASEREHRQLKRQPGLYSTGREETLAADGSATFNSRGDVHILVPRGKQSTSPLGHQVQACRQLNMYATSDRTKTAPSSLESENMMDSSQFLPAFALKTPKTASTLLNTAKLTYRDVMTLSL
jgi:hypothetical protein